MNFVSDWEKIIENYTPVLVRIANGILNNHEDAKDVCQEVYVKLFQIEQDKIKNLQAWLYKVTINSAINLKKQIHYRRTREENNVKGIAKEYNLPDLIEKKEQLELLHDGISKLSKRQKEIFLLKYQTGMTIRQVAQTLEITEGTVKKQLSRAMKKISTCALRI